MPKRKLDQAFGSKEINILQELRAKRVVGKIHHGKTLLQRAMKLAKGFERQKLSRRYKIVNEEKQEAEIARLDREIQAFKGLDVALLAEIYLYKLLLKDKQIRSNSLLPKFVTAADRPVLDQLTATCNARLCNSKPVRNAVHEILQSVCAAMGISNSALKASPARGRGESAKVKRLSSEHVDHDRSDTASNSDFREHRSVSEDQMEDRDKVEFASNENFSEFNSRFASASEESPDDRDLALAKVLKDNIKSTDAEAGSTASLQNSISSTGSEEESPPPPAAMKTKAAFLPSLTLSGYISNSESNPSDDEKLVGTRLRKNRRGQRARQQIWEQKYGAGAKHLQEPKGGKNSRDSGWDMKRGAQSNEHKPAGRGPVSKRRPGVNDGQTSMRHPAKAANIEPQSKRKEAVSRGLHPSWEAARKEKERKKVGVGGFKGSKVVFD